MNKSSASWNQIEVAGEAFWIDRNGPAVLAFGKGPRWAEEHTRDRLEALRDGFGLKAALGLNQVHGATVLDRTGGMGAKIEPEADGHVTRDQYVALVVRTADCVPVLLSGGVWIAAIHAGWRGAAAGILPEAVLQMTARGLPVDELTAAIGPAIGPAHYPVGPEVRDALTATGVDPGAWDRSPAVDLRGFCAAQLETLGLRSITTVGPCTAGSLDLASFRRDGSRAGRQLSLVFRQDP
jgi:YfiH family protein